MRGSCSRRAGHPCRRAATAALVAAALLGPPGCGTLSVPQERELAGQFERDVRQHYRFVVDPVVEGYVDRIGQGIVSAAGPQPFQYRFTVIEDPEINAFAGPAGHIYVQTGTILAARNASELAGVIAHEVGHVVRRHIAQNYEKQEAAGVGHDLLVLGAGIVGGGAAAGAANLVGGLGMMAVLNSFGRQAEREADDFAVHVLPRAGWDPNGLPSFFQVLVNEGGANPPAFLASHPAPADRLQATRDAIARLDLPPGLQVDDDGRLEIIQRRITLLTGETGPRRPGS
jgi:predicted Zn-dependent protease